MGYVQGHQGGCANVEDDFLWFPKVRNVLNFLWHFRFEVDQIRGVPYLIL